MTSLQDELNKAIEISGKNWMTHLASSHQRSHANSFKAGAQSMMPVIELLIKQRNYYMEKSENVRYWGAIAEAYNKDILDLIKGDKT
jgi:hypothetical protein